MKWFAHQGNAGDVIASLPALLAAAQGQDAGIILQYDAPASYVVGRHPLVNVQLSKTWCEQLEPLLLTLLKEVKIEKYAATSQEVTNLNFFRKVGLNMAAGDLRRYFTVGLFDQPALHEPWLDLEPDANFKDQILVNVTGRYHHGDISYHFLQHYPNVTFVGVKEEYERFKAQVPKADFYTGPDFLQLARAIKGCRLFIGVQSFCWWLAEAQGVNRLLQTYQPCPNCIPLTPNGWDATRRQEFEALAHWLIQTTTSDAR